MLRDAVTLRVREREASGIRLIAVDPPFNYRGGIRFNAEAGATTGTTAGGRLRLAVIRVLAPLSVLRDVFLSPALAWVGMRRLRGRWDVCIGVGPWGSLAGIVLRLLGRARILVYRDRDYEPGLVPDRLRRAYTAWLERVLVRRADVVISSGRLLAELRRAQGARAVHVVPNGVEWTRFAPARARTERPGPVVVYVGLLVPWSGLELAIDALAEIRARVPGATLRVIGSGPPAYEARLRAHIARLGLDDAVELEGTRAPDEIPALLAGARVALANSEPIEYRRYACPLKIAEYMAAGVPVVVTAGTEAEAMVEHHGAGLAVPYESAALREALEALLVDDALHARLSAAGVRASADLTWEGLIARELELAQQYLGGHAEPGDGADVARPPVVNEPSADDPALPHSGTR